jgi:hypothetical protein
VRASAPAARSAHRIPRDGALFDLGHRLRAAVLRKTGARSAFARVMPPVC